MALTFSIPSKSSALGNLYLFLIPSKLAVRTDDVTMYGFPAPSAVLCSILAELEDDVEVLMTSRGGYEVSHEHPSGPRLVLATCRWR